MATCEDNHSQNWVLKPHSDQPQLGFTSSQSTDDVTEESLVSKFENVGLKSNENVTASDDQSDSGGVNGSLMLPLRPNAEDCPYYIRTGTCKFGLNCKYSHPVKRMNKVGYDRNNEGFYEKSGQIECKYYLTAGGCKYGKSCRFNHSKPESEIALPELNFLGLPIRLGEKECPFYMRNGSCGYGAGCRFHHPDPISIGGADLYNSNLGGDSVGQYNHSSGNFDGESVPLHLWASQPAQLSWSSSMVSDMTDPYWDNHLSYMPSTASLPQGVGQNREWNGHQVPDYSLQTTGHPRSAPSVNSTMKTSEVSVEVQEYPERPGQPECEFFMKTGDCKFKSECRYHHPKNRAPKAEVVLNDKGLPLRPDKSVCPHYENYGICKFGGACVYDHPAIYAATFPPSGSAPSSSAAWDSWKE